MSILSPVARAVAIAAGTQEAHRRANAGTTTSLSEHVRGIVEAALDAAVAAEHCPYPGCIVVHRDHRGAHVTTTVPGGYLVSTLGEPMPEEPDEPEPADDEPRPPQVGDVAHTAELNDGRGYVCFTHAPDTTCGYCLTSIAPTLDPEDV